MQPIIHLHFDKGTLVFTNMGDAVARRLSGLKWDKRTSVYRAPAYLYRTIVLTLRREQIPYEDHAREFAPLDFPLKETIVPRDFQQAAMQAWLENGSCGVIVLPTGAGKTILAVMLIEKTRRPVLVHVPTIDLMHQWHAVLTRYFDGEVGLLGGGYHEFKPLTVATYDSALIHVTNRGHQVGFAIFDECHHLPGEQLQYTAISTLAPFRLGLTATPERTDGKEARLYDLIGPLCYEAHIQHLEGKTLAPYIVKTLQVEMDEAERRDYEHHRQIYTGFLRRESIDMRQPHGWQAFLGKASRTPDGRQVLKSYRTQKLLSQASAAKLEQLWTLLRRHAGDRILIFTQDNDMAYRIGRRFILPVLTHQTKIKEREAFLQAFRDGTYSILVTSKVLNEGVDVPEANVAVIVSGSGSVREHVQRLGRILRAQPGKHAVLYELISKDTGEHFVNQRRRQHGAYQKTDLPFDPEKRANM